MTARKRTVRKRFTIELVTAWFDLWVGVFVHVDHQCVYVFPVPCIGVRIGWSDADQT